MIFLKKYINGKESAQSSVNHPNNTGFLVVAKVSTPSTCRSPQPVMRESFIKDHV